MAWPAGLAPLDHLICYAVKANSNRAILNLLARAGAGFDIVSGGELFRVLAAGGNPAGCTFAGVGKSADEITYAVEQGVSRFDLAHGLLVVGEKKCFSDVVAKVHQIFEVSLDPVEGNFLVIDSLVFIHGCRDTL